MWSIEEDQLHFVATDSHRLASRKSYVEASPQLSFEHIVTPAKSMQELSKILSDDDLLIDIVATDNQILFKTKNILLFPIVKRHLSRC